MTSDPTAALAARGAVTAPFEGIELVAHFGDPDREWRAAREGAALFPAGYRRLLAATGGDRVEFLQGMVSNDVKPLAAGDGCYAALLNQTGKVVTDLRLYADADRLLLDVMAWRAPVLREALERFLIADDVELAEPAEQPLLQLEGPLARAVAGEALGITALPEAPLAHRTAELDGQLLRVISASEAGGDGILVCGPAAAAARLLDACREAGGAPAGMVALDRLRIEAGIAWPGIDMDETTLIMETGRDAALSFSKGCYLGQEVVERVAARGHVNRRLSGVLLAGDRLPARGTALLADRRPVGYVTSVARSPLFEGPIALAMIQIKHGTVGERLQRADDSTQATVVALPFAPSGSKEERQ
ncbi:MAG TPA: glycine cleavage T C-terminal barrel domain-containing protein [Candidatus Dormibacteraeota bacterium]|nr:glycine cleavage T C-terminal barrel domain-containing protein [Candidatus Dormibacteraeota bacterium]